MRQTTKARHTLGIRGQLMWFLCFICLFLLVLFWILSTQLLEPLYTRHIERQLTTQAENVVSQLDDALAEGTTLSSWSFGRLYVNTGFFDKLAAPGRCPRAASCALQYSSVRISMPSRNFFRFTLPRPPFPRRWAISARTSGKGKSTAAYWVKNSFP